MYGGTAYISAGYMKDRGLSPRVRGNHPILSHAETGEGSIPACTGEPFLLSQLPILLQVYPRVYGGTRPVRRSTISKCGLSPRVRGNRGVARSRPRRPRSIPACTGEPRTATQRRTAEAVYPRVYGGTLLSAARSGKTYGLSPRVRGNHRSDRESKS